MASISDPSLGGTLPTTPIPSTPITPKTPPTSTSSPAPKAATTTPLDLINNRIHTLISEYHTLSNEIGDHTKQLSELTAKASPTDQPKIKEVQEAIAKITGQLTEVDTNLDAEFKKLDDTYTKVVTQESAEAKRIKEGRPKIPADTKSSAESATLIPDIFASAHKWSSEVDQLVDKMSNLKKELSKVDPDHPLGKILDEKASQLQEMSDKRIKPLQAKSKAVIAKIAKKSGEALQAGIAAMRTSQKVTKASSVQPVLLAGKIAVFKKGSKKATEEETLAQGLSHFYPGVGVMSSTRIARAMPSRYGSSMLRNQQDELRSVPLRTLDTEKNVKGRLLKHLPPEDSAAINNYLRGGLEDPLPDIKFKPLMSDEQNAQYERLDNYDWSIETESGDKVTLTLAQVLLIYFEKGLEVMDKVTLIPKEGETTPPPTKEALIEMLKSHGPNFMIIKGDPQVPPTPKESLSVCTLDYYVQKRIESHLSKDDAAALKTYSDSVKPGEPTPDIRIVPIMEGGQKIAYEKCELHKWRYEQSPGNFVELNFHDVQNLYFLYGKEEIRKFSRIDIPSTPGVFGPAPLPPTLEDVRTAFGIIDRTEDQVKAALALCEGTTWQDKAGNTIDFTAFKDFYLKLYGANLSMALSNYKPTDGRVTQEIIRTALKQPTTISFKLVLPELVTSETEAITDVQVKPFADMIIFDKIATHRDSQRIFRSIGEKLTPEAQVQMILTAEFQFLDLHENNLGLVPIPKNVEDYQRFKDENGFQENLLRHLAGTLPPDTSLITYTAEDGSKRQKLLKDFPEYQRALDVKFQFALFDTDLLMSESNESHVQRRDKTGGLLEYLVPIRLAFFDTSLKDVLLSKKCLEIIARADARGEELLAWIRGEDRLPFIKLSALDATIERERAIKEGGPPRKKTITKKEEVLAVITPFIAQYSLAKARAKDTSITIEDLSKAFAKDITSPHNLTRPDIVEMWKTLEESMSVKTKKAQTLEQFAKQHQIDFKELQMLNPDLSISEELPIGTVIRTIDLTTTFFDGKKISVKTTKPQTLEEFSKEHQINLKELRDLNPTLSTSGALPIGTAIVTVDLYVKADENRFRIAKQLFPRLTKAQETALLERQKNRKTYLAEYTKFSEQLRKLGSQDIRSIDLDELKGSISDYISASYSPLSEARKELIGKELGELDNFDDIYTFALDVQAECAPTLFNISKVMYPLLSDNYELSKVLYPAHPGQYIGLHSEPLQTQIAAIKKQAEAARKNVETLEIASPPATASKLKAAREKRKTAEELEKAAERLAARIKAPTVPPGFFGHFG